jgi:hypothetical protein
MRGKPQVTPIPQMMQVKVLPLSGEPISVGQKRGWRKTVRDSLYLRNRRNLRFKFPLLLSGAGKGWSLRLRKAHQDGLDNFTTARIPKGNRKNLPRFSSVPNAIRIERLEPVVLIWRFTTDCFAVRGRPE